MYTEKPFHAFPFGEVCDGNGKQIKKRTFYWEGQNPETKLSLQGISIKDVKQYKNPISIDFSFFPEWIHGDAKIRIR